MKNLATKARFIIFGSVLIASVISPPKAQALEIGQSFSVAQDKELFDNSEEVGLFFRTADFDPLSLGDEYDDVAEVGSYNLTDLEIIRGLSELDVTEYGDLMSEDLDAYNDLSITLYFDIFKQGGVRASNDNPFVGEIELWAYQADGFEDVEDFLKDPLALPPEQVGSILLDGTESAGTIFEFDVKDYVTGLLVTTDANHIGFLLKASNEEDVDCGSGQCTAVTFNNFRFEAVPTPAAILPSLVGILTAASRKKKKSQGEAKELSSVDG